MKKYLVQLSRFGDSSLAIVDLIAETDKTISAKEVESIFGYVHCSSRMNKDANTLYDSLQDAIEAVAITYDAQSNRSQREANRTAKIASCLRQSENEEDVKSVNRRRF